MNILGTIDSTFTTSQRDLFTSGVVGEIGVNAFAIWHAIKHHADFNTGKAFPGMRKLGLEVGLSASSVARAVEVLENYHLVRVVATHTKKRGQTYIARERLSVKVGSTLICTIVMDYVPLHLREKISTLKQALALGETSGDLFNQVEIIPAAGFIFDPTTGTFKGEVPIPDIPLPPPQRSEGKKQLLSDVLKRLNSTSYVAGVKHEN